MPSNLLTDFEEEQLRSNNVLLTVKNQRQYRIAIPFVRVL